jgi:uracil-DNA glycosylase
MISNLASDWYMHLSDEFEKPYFNRLDSAVMQAYLDFPTCVFPNKNDLFTAFNACAFSEVKVVILGQDPYPTKGYAHGLCFSVPSDLTTLPKSLQNISIELDSDIGKPLLGNGNLLRWATQGVLMLNAILTVHEGKPGSHASLGWGQFTDAVIGLLGKQEHPIVFVLWGAFANSKKALITGSQHLILSAPHPSPLSAYRGFFGCKHFSRTNKFLQSIGSEPIDW